MKAIKYRTKSASGVGPWQWQLIADDFTAGDARDMMEEKGRSYDWSDKFRGMEWHTTRKIPAEVLEAKLHAAEAALRSAKAQAKAIKEFMLRVAVPVRSQGARGSLDHRRPHRRKGG